MSLDVLNDQRKSWKGSQADYDDVFSRSNRLCSVCLTEQQIVALLSMTEFLYWPTRWVKASGDVDRQIVAEFAERLERNLMMACCDDNLPIQYRYSPEGILERSLNAGGNWTAAPEYDPRVYSPTFPPIPGTDGNDKKCVAATGAAALVKEQVGDQITEDMTRYTLSQLITDWVATMIGSSNPFQALLTVIVNQIFALVLSALVPALTDAVYDTFRCILYCNIGDDATVNNAQWAEIRSDITDQIGGIAGLFLEHLVYLLGTGGLTNLIRAGGTSTGDCSDCECIQECSPEIWSIFSSTETYGTIVEVGSNYLVCDLSFAPLTVGEYFLRMKTVTVDSCCKVSSYEVVSGGTINISRYSLCGVVQDGTTSHDLIISTGSGADEINLLVIASTGACRVKIYFV